MTEDTKLCLLEPTFEGYEIPMPPLGYYDLSKRDFLKVRSTCLRFFVLFGERFSFVAHFKRFVQ